MNWRQFGERLRQSYSKVSRVPIEEVLRVDLEGDRCAVYAPQREDLPIWTTDGPPPKRELLDLLVEDQGTMRDE